MVDSANIGYGMLITSVFAACTGSDEFKIRVYETSAAGRQFTPLNLEEFSNTPAALRIILLPEEKHQEITGFGGSFTEASAYLLNQLSPNNRNSILQAYFGDDGARYSLTRTHINSCDFSLDHYTYAPVSDDIGLIHFSIDHDKADLIPMIKDAMAISIDGFKILASPWTAPPWMKDNKDWRGGRLLQMYYPVWAKFFSKYLDAYAAEGIPIWGITVENEPLGNDNNWESMHYTPQEMNVFVKNHLGPLLREKHSEVKILGFDQNRDEELYKWVDAMFDDEDIAKYFDGTAVHWYGSTTQSFSDALFYAHTKAQNKHLINTEACIDSDVPAWKNDKWYWSEEATDWGYDWAPAHRKHLHPKYVPVYRYAKDIIDCLNSGVDGWIDWNMVLNRQGGPNWFRNWCVAPVIVDENTDEVYFTPLYYTLMHFSRYIRPGARRIGFKKQSNVLKMTAAENPDGTIVVVLFNESNSSNTVEIQINNYQRTVKIDARAIQTIVLTHSEGM